jgi:hypothetical protein
MKLFISYRRKSWPSVQLLEENLGEQIEGSIFVDYKSIDDTDFERSIIHHLRDSDIVLVVVTEDTFAPNRIHNEKDWVRREIALALEMKKPIIPILIDNYPLPSSASLPENIRDITKKQAIEFYPAYFDAAVRRLVAFITKVVPFTPERIEKRDELRGPRDMGSQAMRTVSVVCCSVLKDERLRKELDSHLASLKRSKQITTWYTRKVQPGMEWEREVDAHLDTADIILLLISANFIASDYCYGRAIEKHAAGKTRVIPVLLRPVDLKGTPLSELQLLPTNHKPVTLWHSRDEAFWQVARDLREVVETMLPLDDGRQEQMKPTTVDQIEKVLALCYRRAIFTKTHAELGVRAMFDSLAQCRSSLQAIVVYVRPEEMQQLVVHIIEELDFIERYSKTSVFYTSEAIATIDRAKLRIIKALRELAVAAQVPYVRPASLNNEYFRIEEEASLPPEEQGDEKYAQALQENM